MRKLREVLPAAFPDDVFYFQAADIVTQILNFGLPSQIDVRVIGVDHGNNLKVAHELQQRIAAIPGIADAHLQQEVDGPAFQATIDRARAQQLGLNANSIASNINVSLSSSQQVQPNFWTDPATGIPYYIAVQTPQYWADSLNDLRNTPVSTALSSSGNPIPGMLSNVVTLTRATLPTNTNQTNIQSVLDIYASVQGADLGSVANQIDKVIAGVQSELAPGNYVQVAGQIQSMRDSFRDLGIGILFAAVFVFLLMVVNYQSFGDPFVVLLGAAGDLLRHSGDAVHHRDHAQRSVIDGRDHGGRRGLGQLDPAGHLRARAAARRQVRLRGGDRRRPYAYSPGADDGRGDDCRDDPHGHRWSG